MVSQIYNYVNQSNQNKSFILLRPSFCIIMSFIIGIFGYGWEKMDIAMLIIFFVCFPFLLVSLMRFKINYFLLIITSLVFLAIISTLVMRDFSFSFVMEIASYYFYVVLGFFCMKSSKEDTLLGLKLIGVFIFILSLLGVIEYIMRTNIFEKYLNFKSSSIYGIEITDSYNYRVRSLFVHPIVYGNILAFALCINIFLFQNNKFQILNFILLTINIIFTKARSVWVLCGLLLLFMLCYTYKNIKDNDKQKKKFIIIFYIVISFLIFLVVLALSGIYIPVLDMIISKFKDLAGSDSINQRTGVIPLLLGKFNNGSIYNILFGNGAHSSKIVMKYETVTISNFGTVDNEWLSILYDFGMVTFIFFIILYIKMIKNIFKTNNILLLFVSLVLVIFLSLYFAFDGFTWISSYSLFFMFVGFIATIYK